jgi:hypothetical protein
MNKEEKMVRNDSETKRVPRKGHNDQLAENIRKILLEKKDPLPPILSGRHPDEFNSSESTPSFRKTSFADIPTDSPAPVLPESCSNHYQNQHRKQATGSLRSPQSVSKEQKSLDVLKHLEIYEDLSYQLDRYTTLLEDAEKQQYSVGSSTYEKVRNEYSEKQSSLNKEREEQKALLQREIEELLKKQTQLRQVCEEQEDRIEEIAFRVTVGEFGEDEIVSESSRLQQELLKNSTDLEEISRILSRSIQIGLLQET